MLIAAKYYGQLHELGPLACSTLQPLINIFATTKKHVRLLSELHSQDELLHTKN